ncbi:MAG: hypothetical protein A2277_13575 [Desulfobacterales bacterium RIFOXYA12_FULL_46_15]|nr:MAG: hypothetical protein A2277_13575 [Desulfobacterales bacterium RIFOXYA12_FULL_46_15]
MEKAASIIIRKIKGFPPLPAVAAKLIKLTGDPDSSIEDIAAIISMDPSFAIETLRLANSPIWGRIHGIASIKEALSVLGISAVRDLILSKAVFNSFKHIGKTGKAFTQKFWEHSFLCGLAANMIADDLKANKDSCFIAGLLHDIGKLVVYLALPGEFVRIADQSEANLFGSLKYESKIIGVTHDRVGQLLLEHWLFPQDLIFAVGYHHHPQKTDEISLVPMIVNIGDIISNCVQVQDETQLDENACCAWITKGRTAFFKKHDKDWNSLRLLQYIERLTTLKEENIETMRLFLS